MPPPTSNVSTRGSRLSMTFSLSETFESLLPRVDTLLVGGGMCFTFLKAQGHDVGDSLLESEQLDACRRFLATGKVVLPVDVVVATTSAPTRRPRSSTPRRSLRAVRGSTSA